MKKNIRSIIKNNITITFILLTILFVSCQGKTTSKINFCERLQADQSFLPNDEMSEIEKEEFFLKRKAEFKKNWAILKEILTSNNFSKVAKDSCFINFKRVTLIHTAQNFPEKIFNEPIIDLLKIEADAGNIEIENLRAPIFYYKNFTPKENRCIKMKKTIDYAIDSWKVNENFEKSIFGKIENIQYAECN